tara:strand:+ start:2102 stop:4213 length:2112 start_codon:yes stop_codon:yes gene_type:complete
LRKSLAKELNIRPSTESKLNELGIKTPLNLLNYFPIRHVDYSEVKKIFQCNKSENVTIVGQVTKSIKRKIGPKMSSCVATLTDDTGFIDIIWHGQPYLTSKYPRGTWISVSGKISKYGNKLQISSPETEIVESFNQSSLNGKIMPIYSLKDKIPQATFRSIIKKCLDKYYGNITEYIPLEILQDLGMLEINKAMKNLHFPKNLEYLNISRKRFLFEKMLFNQIFMLMRKYERQKNYNIEKIIIEDLLINDLKNYFDFQLTDDQINSIDEIIEDLSKNIPMRRILQGEVGSGKTLVALFSLFSIVRAGYQGAFMAPTEILAEQHFINIKEQFGGNNYLNFSNKVVSIKMPGIMERGMIVALLTGNQPPSEKKLIYKLVNNREIDLVIGTHALFQEDFNPTKLGLVVVDEQHRFGVSQRDALIKKSKVPHLLSMSATPIPRSLALTLYGDLEVSTLRNCPKGRKEIDTLWCRKDQNKDEAYLKIYNEIKSGRQAFIVCPLIHKSEKIDSISLEEKIIDLKNSVLKEVKMEVLHGEMNMEEKSEIMNRFKNNEFSLLVATPVIEVGVDIPNATCVIIESADRFGLAQLHQIRGRVGRGTEKSYCYLFTRNISENADERLNSFEKTKNGFDLAEADLKIRGPGDYIGSKQSGMNDISYEMINDNETLSDSRKWATKIVSSNVNLGIEYNNLREEFKKRFDFTNAGIS